MPSGAERRVSVFAADRSPIAESQRQRLVHGVTVAVADKGLAATTVGDIATRAGVSKKTLYEHFADKLDCFLAAYDHGSTAMLRAVNDAALADGLDAVQQLRAGTAAYLDFLAFEEPYARTFCLEMLAAGPKAVARHRASRDAFSNSLRIWHTGNGFAPLDALAYEAATGLVYEVASARVATGNAAELPALTDAMTRAQLTQLGVT
jgi:AcrR family transcriptional regulator